MGGVSPETGGVYMRNMNRIIIGNKTLPEVLHLHNLYLRGDSDGECANLSYMNLERIDLKDANLSRANLRNANLEGADLSYCRLEGADLSYCTLTGANLSQSNLRSANLERCQAGGGATLWGANLKGANMSNSYLRHAILKGANLEGADLSCSSLEYADLALTAMIGTNLYHANIQGANLQESHISGVDMTGLKYDHTTSYFAIQCPEEGSFIGYKKCNGHLVKLLILEDAKRSSATTRKCRCSKAKVLEISDGLTWVRSDYSEDFIYTVGSTIEILDFDTCRWNECTSGIHFFLTKEEALQY